MISSDRLCREIFNRQNCHLTQTFADPRGELQRGGIGITQTETTGLHNVKQIEAFVSGHHTRLIFTTNRPE